MSYRDRFPQIAEVVDRVRVHFPDAAVLYCREGEDEATSAGEFGCRDLPHSQPMGLRHQPWTDDERTHVRAMVKAGVLFTHLYARLQRTSPCYRTAREVRGLIERFK